jgi:hypothetical protein
LSHPWHTFNTDYSFSQAYAAERSIRTVKDRLGTALALNDKGDNRWLPHLEKIVKDHNSRFVKGSKTIRRDEVNKFNVNKLLAEKYHVADFTPNFNMSVVGNFSKEMLKAIPFKYQVGQKVLLSRSANYTLKTDSFAKRSAEGSYGKQVFEVENVFLKTNNKNMLSMVYKIRDLEGLFYSTEIVPANFSEADDARNEDADDRKRKAAKAKKKRERT